MKKEDEIYFYERRCRKDKKMLFDMCKVCAAIIIVSIIFTVAVEIF